MIKFNKKKPTISHGIAKKKKKDQKTKLDSISQT